MLVVTNENMKLMNQIKSTVFVIFLWLRNLTIAKDKPHIQLALFTLKLQRLGHLARTLSVCQDGQDPPFHR